MSGTLNRAQIRKQLQNGLNALFGMTYNDHSKEFPAIFGPPTQSKKAYEEDVLVYGLGPGQVKPEGGPVTYDGGGEAWTARYHNLTVALAFRITQEAEEDGLYGSQGARYSRALARSMRHTQEVYGANVLNNGFDANYPGGDGVSLYSTAHPLRHGGTFSNMLATPADLSETSLESAFVQIARFVDDRGLPILVRAQRLIVPPELRFEAHRILNTVQRPGTADNDTNAMRDMRLLPGGFSVNHRLWDPKAWHLTTDCPDGLKHMERVKISAGMEGDFETGDLRYKSRQRYSFGHTDPRGAFGSQGG